MEIRPIRTEEDYEQGLDELAMLMDEGEDTPNLDKLELLSALIGAYETEHYPAEKPKPVEALQYYMESRGISYNYTVGEFEQILAQTADNDRLLELIHGEIIEKAATEEHGIIVGNALFALHRYAQIHKSGRVGALVRHHIPEDEWNSRIPDVSYSTVRRALVTKGSVPAMPDLAVEVQSADDSIKAMREKATYYLANGAKVVWLVYPRKRMVEVYAANGNIDILREGDTLSGEEVLPGFTMPVADFFDDPFTT